MGGLCSLLPLRLAAVLSYLKSAAEALPSQLSALLILLGKT